MICNEDHHFNGKWASLVHPDHTQLLTFTARVISLRHPRKNTRFFRGPKNPFVENADDFPQKQIKDIKWDQLSRSFEGWDVFGGVRFFVHRQWLFTSLFGFGKACLNAPASGVLSSSLAAFPQTDLLRAAAAAVITLRLELLKGRGKNIHKNKSNRTTRRLLAFVN